MKYRIILDLTSTGYSAYSPDLDGCVAAAEGREETIALIEEAIAFHLEGLAEGGTVVPEPSSESVSVEIPSDIFGSSLTLRPGRV